MAISTINVKSCGDYSIREYQGLSSDTKPTSDVASGSSFYELDTGKMWLYDANNVNSVTSDGWWEITV